MNAREQILQKRCRELEAMLRHTLQQNEYLASVGCAFAWDLVHASKSNCNEADEALYDMECEWDTALKAVGELP